MCANRTKQSLRDAIPLASQDTSVRMFTPLGKLVPISWFRTYVFPLLNSPRTVTMTPFQLSISMRRSSMSQPCWGGTKHHPEPPFQGLGEGWTGGGVGMLVMEGGYGGGSGIQRFVYQRWPKNIFPLQKLIPPPLFHGICGLSQ